MLSLRKERKGFTLIELMIVVAIIGILAAIAIPQFARMREKGQDAAAKAALGNLKTAQEAYYLENDAYTTNTSKELDNLYKPEKDVTVTISTITSTDGIAGWSATASHSGSSSYFTYNSLDGGLSDVAGTKP